MTAPPRPDYTHPVPVTTPLPLGAAPLTLEAIAEVARRDRPVTIADDARATMATARASIDQVVAEGDRARAVYGVNTGFGALAEVRSLHRPSRSAVNTRVMCPFRTWTSTVLDPRQRRTPDYSAST